MAATLVVFGDTTLCAAEMKKASYLAITGFLRDLTLPLTQETAWGSDQELQT